jgi:hypothetical protein
MIKNDVGLVINKSQVESFYQSESLHQNRNEDILKVDLAVTVVSKTYYV